MIDMSRRALLLLAAITALSGCGRKPAAPPPAPVPVLTARAVSRTVPLTVETTGTVEAFNSLDIIPRVSGQVLKLHFKDGDEVEKDSLLVTLDRAPFEEALREAEARLAGSEATLFFKKSEAERKRLIVAEGGVSRSEFEKAQSEAELQRDTVQAARAVVEQAKLNVGYCSILSPISGYAGAYLVNRGAVVEANKTRLLVVNQVKPVYVTFSVPDKELPAIRAARERSELTVEARLPEPGSESRTGCLTFVDNKVDDSSGMIRLKGTFDNEDSFLWPGLFVRVSLVVGEEPDVTVIPAAAVAKGPRGDLVFTVRDGTAHIRPVQVHRMVGNEVVLDSGVQPGEIVVTDGLNKLKDGAPVTISNAQDHMTDG